MKRSPVTLLVAFLCVLATFIAPWIPVGQWPLISWLVHYDAQHLGVVLVTWLALGVWMEHRAGSSRVALWIAAGLGLSTMVHWLIHPDHTALVGLSAVAFFVFAAGIAACALDRPTGWAGLAGIALVLAQEWRRGTSPGEEFIGALVGDAWQFAWARGSATPVAVPAVHSMCAGAGVAFGLLAVAARARRRVRSVAPARPTVA